MGTEQSKPNIRTSMVEIDSKVRKDEKKKNINNNKNNNKSKNNNKKKQRKQVLVYPVMKFKCGPELY